MLLTLPGTPFIYYGEEIGLQNGPNDDDEWKRTPMPWDGTKTGGFTTGKPWNGFAPGREQTNVAAQANDPTSLLSTYKQLLAARHKSRALQRGRFELLTSNGPTLAYRLTDGSEQVLVVHNLGNEEASAALALGGATVDAPLLSPEAAKVTPDAAGTRVALPAHTTGIWRLK
jgi:glycosidase